MNHEKHHGHFEAPREKKRLTGRQKGALGIVLALAVLIGLGVGIYKTVVRPPQKTEPVVETQPEAEETKEPEIKLPTIKHVVTKVDEDTGEEVEEEMELPASHREGVYNILICGTDDDGYRTDTIIVAHLDEETHDVALMSVPRDTAVNVSYKPKKMNQYYAAAENNGKDGVEALIGGAEQILGYRVDSYALFDVEVFVELIDAMGGIDFDVPVDMDYDDPGQNLSIHVQKGYQHLNGYQTMGVFRFRNTYANGDIGRIDVQHQLLKAMTSQFLKLHNIPNLNKLIDIYEKDVTTNLSAGNVMFYVKEFLKLDESAISFETIPANYSGTKNGMSYVFIHVDEWLDYLNTWLNPYTEEITSADVDILYESNGQVVATSGTVQGPNKW